MIPNLLRVTGVGGRTRRRRVRLAPITPPLPLPVRTPSQARADSALIITRIVGEGWKEAQEAQALEARSLHRDRDRYFPGRPKASECRDRTIDVGPVSHRCVCHPGA